MARSGSRSSCGPISMEPGCAQDPDSWMQIPGVRSSDQGLDPDLRTDRTVSMKAGGGCHAWVGGARLQAWARGAAFLC
eukprot:8637635-Pyramimonas_sp.AAC.1